MKLHWRLAGLDFIVLCGVLLAGLLFSGCATPEEPVFSTTPVFSDVPSGTEAGTVTVGATNSGTTLPGVKLAVLEVGNQVIVTFSDAALQRHEERIKEDGTITLYLIGPVKAAGMTTGELQKKIQDLYVEKGIYRPGRLNVTVTVPDLFFYVGGEVNQRGPKLYPGAMTVTKAIQTAGDFTDYAKKTAVQLTRAGSDKPIKVNVKEALKDPRKDLPVYPGDKIHVPRRFLFE